VWLISTNKIRRFEDAVDDVSEMKIALGRDVRLEGIDERGVVIDD